MFTSCKKSEIIAIKEVQNGIDFFGEKLILREDISHGDVKNYISTQNDINKAVRLNAENNSVLNLIPDNVFYKFVKTAILNYPNLNNEKFNETELSELKRGLPNLKSIEEASNEKKTIIYEFVCKLKISGKVYNGQKNLHVHKSTIQLKLM